MFDLLCCINQITQRKWLPRAYMKLLPKEVFCAGAAFCLVMPETGPLDRECWPVKGDVRHAWAGSQRKDSCITNARSVSSPRGASGVLEISKIVRK